VPLKFQDSEILFGVASGIEWLDMLRGGTLALNVVHEFDPIHKIVRRK